MASASKLPAFPEFSFSFIELETVDFATLRCTPLLWGVDRSSTNCFEIAYKVPTAKGSLQLNWHT
jgi:hypothetical protein